MKYVIWERFSPDARRAVVAAKYVKGTDGGFARTAQDCCPLGVALAADGLPQDDVARCVMPVGWDYPGASSVARAFGDRALVAEAARWINDWDGGKIRPGQLAALLEVTP